MIGVTLRSQSRKLLQAGVSVVAVVVVVRLLVISNPANSPLDVGSWASVPGRAPLQRSYQDPSQEDSLKGSVAAPTLHQRGSQTPCTPRRHIMYLKTHKCASSSVQNMLLRYGITHNLTFALPAAGNYLGNPRLFRAGMLPKNLLPPDGVVDLFVVHTRLNPPEHRKVLHPDTVFVTVVRDPAMLFESLYNYFSLAKHFNQTALSKFVNLPFEKQMSMRRRYDRFGPNMMLFDMGIDVQPNMTAIDIRRAIDRADEIFDLVMIAEKMDESLILLKELLCWDYRDVVFFTKNARREEVKSEISVSTVQKIRELNSGDALLYDHFLAKHEQRVLKYGPQKMENEVAILKALREDMFDYCGTHVVAAFAAEKGFKEYSGQVNGYVPDKKEDLNCLMLSLPELSALNKIRIHQSELLAKMRASESSNSEIDLNPLVTRRLDLDQRLAVDKANSSELVNKDHVAS